MIFPTSRHRLRRCLVAWHTFRVTLTVIASARFFAYETRSPDLVGSV